MKKKPTKDQYKCHEESNNQRAVIGKNVEIETIIHVILHTMFRTLTAICCLIESFCLLFFI